MIEELWAALPLDVREKVDACVARRRCVQAIHVVRSSPEGAGTSIPDGVDLVSWRMDLLTARLEPPVHGPGGDGPAGWGG